MTIKKHAYLIMAHDNFSTLDKLIEVLDDVRNDIYIHIDAKTKINYELKNRFKQKKSKVFFIKRIEVNWGGFSQIQCELNLLKVATKKTYFYYHLISGTDFPLKNQEQIHAFFEENSGKEFVHFDRIDSLEDNLMRIKYYHIFQDINLLSKNRFLRKLRQIGNSLCIRLQKLIGIDRLKEESSFYMKGANWFSITDPLAKYVVSKEEWILSRFKNTLCCDEVFLQTIVYNSRFKNNLYYKGFNNNYLSVMRYIDWNKGNPYTWRIEDINDLLNSPYLFARKFDEEIDNNVIHKLMFLLLKEKDKAKLNSSIYL